MCSLDSLHQTCSYIVPSIDDDHIQLIRFVHEGNTDDNLLKILLFTLGDKLRLINLFWWFTDTTTKTNQQLLSFKTVISTVNATLTKENMDECIMYIASSGDRTLLEYYKIYVSFRHIYQLLTTKHYIPWSVTLRRSFIINGHILNVSLLLGACEYQSNNSIFALFDMVSYYIEKTTNNITCNIGFHPISFVLKNYSMWKSVTIIELLFTRFFPVVVSSLRRDGKYDRLDADFREQLETHNFDCATCLFFAFTSTC